MTDLQRRNLALSRSRAEGQQARPIRCPHCGMRVMDVFGYSSNLVSVKCPKCKAVLVLDTSLFRTARPRHRYGYGRYSNGRGEGDWEPSPFLPSLGRYAR